MIRELYTSLKRQKRRKAKSPVLEKINWYSYILNAFGFGVFRKMVMKTILVSQSKMLSEKDIADIKDQGLTLVYVFSRQEAYDEVYNDGTKKNPKYKISSKRNLKDFLGGSHSGFSPVIGVAIGSNISKGGLLRTLGLRKFSKIPSKFYTFHISGDEISPQIIEGLRIRSSSLVLYSVNPIEFTSIVKIEKKELYRIWRSKKSIFFKEKKNQYIYGAILFLSIFFSGVLVPMGIDYALDYFSEPIEMASSYVEEAVNGAFEEKIELH